MTAAAEAFGNDIHHPPLATNGPTEVRQAAAAFNRMQERVREMMAERTQILAAVTHDLKTPLTRMRLRLKAAAMMRCARSSAATSSRCSDWSTKGWSLRAACSLSSLRRASISTPCFRPLPMMRQMPGRRALQQGYPRQHPGELQAECAAPRRRESCRQRHQVRWRRTARAECRGSAACIRISDEGPGIPDERLAECTPLRPARILTFARESGGTGLGLAIASNLVSAQGGRLVLENRPTGGLAATIMLPLD